MGMDKLSKEVSFKKNELDGIVFYVSSDGKQTGMSIKGLARVCGITPQPLRVLLENTEKGIGRVELLIPYSGKVFISKEGEADDDARVISSAVCASVIEYYAFESRNAANDTARQTFRKFASIGIDAWIKQITEFAKDNKDDEILAALRVLTTKVDELTAISTKYNKQKNFTSATFPGLDEMLDKIAEEENPPLLVDTHKGMTLTEWLLSKQIKLSKGGICKFGRLVAETYRSCARKEPKKGHRRNPSSGKWTSQVRLYLPEEFPLLEMALAKFVQS
jgi:hypothetical protein